VSVEEPPIFEHSAEQKPPVLVTGGAGSLGRRVVARFLADGRRVRVLDLPDVDYTGLDGTSGIEVFRADIAGDNDEATSDVLEGVGAVVHLAALLPPRSEENRDKTFAVNVGGTERLAKAMRRAAPEARFVFSSSVTIYGDTSDATGPVGPARAPRPLDVYAESKAVAETRLREICRAAVVLRISGIAVPAFQEPPEPWPFTADQSIEFVHREDVVSALCAAAEAGGAEGCVFNIAGGRTWRTTGLDYVRDYFRLLGVPEEEARFRTEPGPFGSYDTTLSQQILRYQETAYATYLEQLRTAIDAMIGELQ
jgi:nucleoside-diphosphate-sugar epimerase